MQSPARRLLGLFLILLAFVATSSAQILTGSLTGTVSDQAGAVVPNATVKATDTATGRVYTTTTDSTGNYTFLNLPNSKFDVAVEASGFARYIGKNVTVAVSQLSKFNAHLQIAAASTEVVVTAEQETVQSETVELKYTIDRSTIMSMPLATRNPMDLVKILPGVTSPTNSSIGDAFVHGLRGNATNITLDGINVADNFVKTSPFFGIQSPIADTIGEFNVSVGGVGVDAGFGAAQVSMRTQRGGNAYHGEAWWYQRNTPLNANTYTNKLSGTVRPFQLQNRIGVSLGGPVSLPKVYSGKNKTFFFGTYEIYREPLSRTRSRSVLSDPARLGTFSYKRVDNGATQTLSLLTLPGAAMGPAGAPVLNAAIMGMYNKYVPPANSDIGTGCSPDGLNVRCYTFNVPGKNLQERLAVRLDHQINDTWSVEASFNQQIFDTSQDFLNNADAPFNSSTAGFQASKRQLYSGAVHTTTSRWTNTARAGVNRSPVVFGYGETFQDTGGYQINFPTVANPLINTNRPQGRNTPVWQITDNFQWARGAHTFTVGGEFRSITSLAFTEDRVTNPRIGIGTNGANANGIVSASFPGGISSTDLGRAQSIFNIVTGMMGSLAQRYNFASATSGFVKGQLQIRDPFQHNWAFFFQDDWKMKQNLKMQYGVRWEYQGIFDYRNGTLVGPVNNVADVWGAGGVGNPFNVLGTCVVATGVGCMKNAADSSIDFYGATSPRRLYNPDYNNFAPFLGISYSPGNSGKTVIRSGIAVHFTQDGFTNFTANIGANTGTSSLVSNSSTTGPFSAAAATAQLPAQPAATFPQSLKTQYAANNAVQLWAVNPTLKTPYVIEWNLAVQRELGKRITVEARYVGNHGVKLYRAWNTSEINLLKNPYTFGADTVANALTEFQNAASNLAICTANRVLCTGTATGTLTMANKGVAGQVNTPILSALFQGAAASGFTNSTLQTLASQGQTGAFWQNIRTTTTYNTNMNNSFPANFFVPQPFSGQFTGVQDNSSWSRYDGFEFELRRRFSSGLMFQGSYTWSKVLTDQRFLTAQDEFQSYRSIANPGLDRNRASFDTHHAFNGFVLYPLPLGRGKLLFKNANGAVDRLVGHWQIQGTTRVATGSPFSIVTSRSPTGSLISETAVLKNMSISQLKNFIGTFKTTNGVFWLDPKSGLLTVVGTGAASTTKPTLCAATTTTPCFDFPVNNQMGNLPFFGFEGPFFVVQDMSVIKEVPIREKMSFQIRIEAFNAFNHALWANPGSVTATNNIENAQFGKLNDLLDTSRGGGVNSRVIQWAIRFSF